MQIIECRSFKHFKEEDFIAALQNVPWYTAYLYEDSDDIWEHWSKLYNDVLELHAPLKKKQIRWITPEITREMSPRNRLFKQYKKNPTSHSWQSYRKQRNKVTSLKRKGMKAFAKRPLQTLRILVNFGDRWNLYCPTVNQLLLSTLYLPPDVNPLPALWQNFPRTTKHEWEYQITFLTVSWKGLLQGRSLFKKQKFNVMLFFWQNNMARHFIPRSLKNSSLHFSKSVFLSRPVLLVNRIEVQCLFSIPTITLT